MFGRARFAYFVYFLVLLGYAAAAKLYRMDDRTPEEVQAAGGLVSWNPKGKGTVIQHVRKELGKQDPWVSTTSDKKLASKGATSPGNVYVYYINPSGLKPVDTIKEFQKKKEKHPHPAEKEFSVKGSIPWDKIASWDTFKRGKKIATTTREEFESGAGPADAAEKRSIRSFVA